MKTRQNIGCTPGIFPCTRKYFHVLPQGKARGEQANCKQAISFVRHGNITPPILIADLSRLGTTFVKSAVLTRMKALCNGCSIYKVTFADGTQDVRIQLRKVYHTLENTIETVSEYRLNQTIYSLAFLKSNTLDLRYGCKVLCPQTTLTTYTKFAQVTIVFQMRSSQYISICFSANTAIELISE